MTLHLKENATLKVGLLSLGRNHPSLLNQVALIKKELFQLYAIPKNLSWSDVFVALLSRF